jgi:predicted PurR-regulated permease PerM
MLLILIFSILLFDYHIFFATAFSLLIIYLTRNLIKKMNAKFMVPLWLIGFLYVAILASCIVLASKAFVNFVLEENLKLIEVFNDKDLIEKKISNFHYLLEEFFDKILFFKDYLKDSAYSAQIDRIVSDVSSDFSKTMFSSFKSLVGKLYIPGFRIIDIAITILLSLAFLFYLIIDFYSLQRLSIILFGSMNKKVLQTVDHIKNIFFLVIFNQLKVSLILFSIYSGVFYLVGFEYFIIYSIFFGLFTVVPIIGSLISTALLLISCYIFGYTFSYSLKLYLILLCGFFLENLVLTPRFVGGATKTHPVVVIAGALIIPQFIGIVGLIFTLPIVAIINSFAIKMIDKIQSEKGNLNEFF